ncbi:hypothetical protein FE257_011231 [Aspergillus nanangensis]|uniref:Uncharacterized protein n=1 Tax=Aspergillus nanangensis TaxID=2582783 RepID=A0AAD4CHJ3_ASPNN|nr:hypothetical protein FE257_011231 [Aspergillus nanangensis]
MHFVGTVLSAILNMRLAANVRIIPGVFLVIAMYSDHRTRERAKRNRLASLPVPSPANVMQPSIALEIFAYPRRTAMVAMPMTIAFQDLASVTILAKACRKLYLHESCNKNEDCLSGMCLDDQCKVYYCPEDEQVCSKDSYCLDHPEPQDDSESQDKFEGATCVPSKEQGESCSSLSHGECGEGLCVDNTCTPPIEQQNDLGGSCDLSKGHACVKGGYCENKKCLSDGRRAAKCDICSNKVAFCEKEVCTARWSLHEPCSKDYQCLSNRCQHGLCGTKETKALEDPCTTDSDCNDGLDCQLSQGIAGPGRICGVPISQGRGQRCKKTSDCSSYNYYCYKGDCMDIDSVEGKTCDNKGECGGQIRKEGSGGTWYLKIGFTCDNHKCHYANKHDGCIRFFDRIFPGVQCYE